MKENFRIYALAWILPGFYFFLSGHRLRGGLLFLLITGTFIGGLAMGGGLFSLSGDFVSVLSSAARGGVGLPWLIGLVPGFRYTDMVSGEIGACFATVAGLMNIMAVISSPDVKKIRY